MRGNIIGISILSLFIATAHADFESLQIQNFNADYKSPEGQASATIFDVPPVKKPQSEDEDLIQMRFFQRENDYVFEYQGEEFVWKNPPKDIYQVDSFKIEKFNMKSGGNKIELDLEKLDLISQKSQTYLRTLNGNCQENPGSTLPEEKVLDSCTTNASINFSLLYLKDSSLVEEREVQAPEKLLNLFGLVIKKSLFKQNPISQEAITSTTEIKNFALRVKDHNFNAQMQASIGISAKVTMEGVIEYNTGNKQLKIRLDKAKASFLNIKEKIFSSIEDAKSPQVEVKRPYIYVNLDTP